MKISTFLLVATITFCLSIGGVFSSEDVSGLSADDALNMLMDGNARFVSGNATHPNQSPERLAELMSGQHPFAVIIGCSDSRVPPELIFDQGFGDIFVIRNAGEVMDNVTIASVEYAVEHLGVPLVMVLGHDSCGAVTATVEDGETPGHIGSITEAIMPAVDSVRSDGDEAELLNRSIDSNVIMGVETLTDSEPILKEKVDDGSLKIVGARYHLSDGSVELLQ